MQRQAEADFGIPELQQALDKPSLSLAINMQLHNNDLAWSVPSPSSYGVDELFRTHCVSDLGRGYVADFSPGAHQNVESPGDRSAKSYCSSATKRDSRALESDLDISPSPKKPMSMTEYRPIFPKQDNSSAEIVEGVSSNRAARRGLKKGGRRGSLKPEKRQKATEMRDIRACASCYINHTEVS